MNTRNYLCLCLLCFLCACSGKDIKPVISFVGVASGTLSTDLANLQFSEKFEPRQRNLVGVVGFTTIANGSTVQATWFSPDERRIPLGRSTITTASGATIVRFSFASRADWLRSPYQLRIDAWHGKSGEAPTGSGSTSFFIGMKDKEIAAYRDELKAYKEAERQHMAEMAAKEAAAQAAASASGARLSASGARF